MTERKPDIDCAQTGMSYVGIRDGRCVAVGYQFQGPVGEVENRVTVEHFTSEGFDVLVLPDYEAQQRFRKDANFTTER